MRVEFRYGKKIQQAREERAWTQEQLAIAAGVEPRTIQRVEKDQTKNPETLQAIAAAFDIELNALRTKWRVAESRLVRTWLVTTFREFVDVQESHPWHVSSRVIVAPLTEVGREEADELLKQIFADRDCIEPYEADLWDCYLQQIREPIRALFEMGLAIFIMDEHRDLLLPTAGNMKPTSDHMEWRVQHFWAVPRHGCFRTSDATPLHSFNTSCRVASEVLYAATKKKQGLHVFANALWAAMPPRSESSIYWCDDCFPPASSGGHLTLEYIERVTGLKRFQIDAICDAINGQPDVEGLA